jgi:imidazolonepropionase-like amidohydrolase
LLQKAGVQFAICDEDGQQRGKNLPFQAGTAAAYGLTKEEALTSITLNAAKILGIADRTGSIETGKDANIVISEGDILDMRSSNISLVMISGRMVSLTDKHKQLYDRYMLKYGLK